MNLKRYNLVLPEHLFNEIKEAAEENHTSVVGIIRKYLRIGLTVNKIMNNPDSEFIVKDTNGERKIIFI